MITDLVNPSRRILVANMNQFLDMFVTRLSGRYNADIYTCVLNIQVHLNELSRLIDLESKNGAT